MNKTKGCLIANFATVPEHLSELQTVFGFRPFTMSHYRQAVQMLTELAMQTDKGIVLASALIGHLRR